jgi:hypothetical protein
MKSLKVGIQFGPSFRRRPESSNIGQFWIPAFAGMTRVKTFTKSLNINVYPKSYSGTRDITTFVFLTGRRDAEY